MAVVLTDEPSSRVWERVRPRVAAHVQVRLFNSLMLVRSVETTPNIVQNAEDAIHGGIQNKLIFGKFVI